MEKEKKTSSAYAKFVKFFSSRVLRNIVFIALMLLSVLFMFMLDKGNGFRKEHLQFMDSNFVQGLLDALNIGQFNIQIGGWVLFFCILGIALFMFIGNILSPYIIGKTIKAKESKFKSPASCKALYCFLYYGAIFLICAALIFMCYMLGCFKSLSGADVDVILNLVYAVLLCLLFIVLIVIALFLVYFVLKLIIMFFAFIVLAVRRMSSDVSDTNAKSIKDLEEARKLAAKNKGEKGRAAKSAHDYAHNDVGTDITDDEGNVIGKSIFPTLVEMDKKAEADAKAKAEATAPLEKPENEMEETLDGFARRFQAFAISHNKIYYELPLIRSFIAGLATTRLLVLEGLSGTGKSMLPRMFCDFIGSDTYFSPVQSTWRDKTDVLGFYSEFTNTFKATDFLERLYGASYNDKVNLMVLDEMNLSRIEYYFADFLSVLEYPSQFWKVRAYEPQENQVLPARLENGYVTIPTNTWFIGTANTDDSTFTITDKVYDRAIVLDFSDKFMPIESNYDDRPVNITAGDLNKMFTDAMEDESKRLNSSDLNKFFKICDFMREAFDVRFGNRIMVQIENFVPVYVALGGTKEEALDFMFARKILRKLGGVFEDYVKEELVNLTKLLNANYGKGTFKETERAIAKILNRLG